MRKFLLIFTLCFSCFAQENLIEIYQNHTFLHQNFKDLKSEFSTKVPPNLDISAIDIYADCAISSAVLSEEFEVLNPEKEKIKDEITKLQDQNDAINAKISFLIQSSNESGDRFYEATLKDYEKISANQKQIEKLVRKLGSEPVKQAKNLNIKFDCEPKNLRLSYPVFIDFKLDNKISANIKAQNIEILQNLSLKNPLVFDLENLDIAIYPFDYLSNIMPPSFYQNFGEKQIVAYAAKSAQIQSSEMVVASDERAFVSDVWKIQDVALKSGETKSFEYDRQVLEAKFKIFIDGYAGSNAYLMAKITPQKHITPTQARFVVDGVQVGSDYINGYEAHTETILFLGKNHLIKVVKKVDEKSSENSLLGGKKTIVRAWDYKITNGSEFGLGFELVERLPLSENKAEKSQIKAKTSPDIVDKDGEVRYNFTLEKGQSKDIGFGYEITRLK